MKPGLWEIENKVNAQNSELGRQIEQLRQQLASLPPEQRAMVEAMMAKHAGAALPSVTADGMKVTMCLSREMAARNELPVQQNGNCTHQRAPLKGNTIKMTFTCSEPPASGEGTIVLQGDSGYSMDLNMTAALNGKQETTSMRSTGKWLGADCGKLKAPPLPAQH